MRLAGISHKKIKKISDDGNEKQSQDCRGTVWQHTELRLLRELQINSHSSECKERLARKTGLSAKEK